MDEERKKIVDEIFRVTGRIVLDTDPVVTAALFFSHKLLEAGTIAAKQISDAAVTAQASVQAAQLACQTLQVEQRRFVEIAAGECAARASESKAERSKMAAEIDAKVQRWAKTVGRVQSTDSGRRISAWYPFAAFFAGIALSLGVEFVWFDFSLNWTNDLLVGRAFNRAKPNFDPDLRKRLIEYFEKHEKGISHR